MAAKHLSSAKNHPPQGGALRGHPSSGTHNISIGDLGWEILQAHNVLEGLSVIYADALEISRPQWNILAAVRHLDQEAGVAVKTIATKLNVDASFITTQSKILEKKGYLKRAASMADARVVLLSLTDRASKRISKISSLQETVFDRVFSDFSKQWLDEIAKKLSIFSRLLAKAVERIRAES